MSTTNVYPQASSKYNSAKTEAINALNSMTHAMRLMGTEHVNFHNHFDGVQKKVQDMKKAYGSKELHVEAIRSIALDGYLSESNLPRVTAFGHLEVQKALKEFQLQEKELDEIHRKTATLVESLQGGAQT